MADLNLVHRGVDRAVLEELVKRGDDLTTVRQTLVFFLRRKSDARDGELVFNPLAAELVARGWTIHSLHADGISGEAQRLVDPASTNNLSTEMEALAAEFGVNYDGWECAIMGEKK
ncbi:MAG: ribonuclease E inhibitor RraB [Hyphomonadaceae bacterium]